MIHPTVSSQSSQTGEHLSQTSNGKTGKLRKKIQKISDSQITVPVQKKSSDQHLNAKNKNGRGKKTPNGHSNHQLPPVETAFDYKALEKTQFADEWVAKFSYYLFNDKDSEFGKLLAEGKALIEEHCNTYPNEAFYVLLHLIKSDQMTLPESILLFSKICESKNQNIDQDIVEELCIEFCLKMKNGTQKAGTSEQNGSLKQRIAIITFLKVHNIKNSDEINNLLLDKCVTEEFLKINKTKETPRAKNSSLQTFEQLTEEHKGKDPDLWIATLKSNLSNKNFDQFLKIHADNPSFAAQVFESFFMERIKTLTEKSNSIAIKDLIVLRLKVIERLPESFNPSTIQSVDIPLIEFSQTKDRDAYFSGWSLFEKIIKQKIEHNTSINIEIVLNTFFHHGINRKDSLKSELTKKTSNFINNYLDKFHHTIHLNSFIDIAKNKLQIKNVDTIARKENIQLEQMIYLALKPVINPSETISDSESEFLWFQIPLQMSASEEKRAIEYFELVYKKIYSKFSQDEASNYRLFLYLYQKTDAYLKTACSDNIKAALIDLLVLEYPLAHRFPQEAKDKLLSLTLSKEIIWKISLYLCEDIDVKNLTKKDRARIRKILKNLINEIFQKPFSYLKINKFFTILQKFHSLSSEFGSLFENTVKQILRYFKNNPIKINESEAIVGLLSNLELIVGCRNIIFEEFKNSQIEDQKRLQLDSTISLFQLLDMAKIIDSNEIFLSHTRNILDSLIHFHKTQIAHSRDINGDLRLCTTLLGILINRAPGLANSDQNEIRKYSRNEICEYSKIILDLIQHISDSNFKVEEDSILCRLYSTPSILSQLFDGYETREELNKTYELLKKICHPITSNTSTNRSQHPTLSSILEDLSKAEILQHDVILKFYTSFLPKAENLIKKSAITLFFEKILPQEILSQGSFLQQMWTPLIDFSNDFDHFSLILSYLPLIDQYSNLCDNHAKFESFYELLAKKIEFFCSQELKPDSQKIILSAISKLFNLFCDGKIAIKLQPLFMAILNKSISSQDINNILRPIQPTSEAKFIAKKHILDMALFVKKINKRNYQLKMESLWQNYFNLKFRKPISNVPVECFTQFYQHLGASEIVDGLCVFFKFIMKNSDATHLSVNLNQIWELVEEINNKHTQHGFLILEFIKGTLKNFKNYPLSFQNFVLEKVQSYFDKKESNLNNLGFHFSLILAFLVIHPRNESFELPQLVQKFIDEWLALFNETYNFEKVCPDAYWCFNFLNDQRKDCFY